MAVLDKGELEERLASTKRITSRCKKYIEHGKENERRTRQNTRIQVIQEQTDEFINQLNEAESSLNLTCRLFDANLEMLKKHLVQMVSLHIK